MRTIVAGSRTIEDYDMVCNAIETCPWEITEIVSGHAFGVDRLGEEWAMANDMPMKIYPAMWDKYGKSAGYARNVEMAEYAHGLIAIWDSRSKGTAHMIRVAKINGLAIHVVHLGDTGSLK